MFSVLRMFYYNMIKNVSVTKQIEFDFLYQETVLNLYIKIFKPSPLHFTQPY